MLYKLSNFFDSLQDFCNFTIQECYNDLFSAQRTDMIGSSNQRTDMIGSSNQSIQSIALLRQKGSINYLYNNSVKTKGFFSSLFSCWLFTYFKADHWPADRGNTLHSLSTKTSDRVRVIFMWQ